MRCHVECGCARHVRRHACADDHVEQREETDVATTSSANVGSGRVLGEVGRCVDQSRATRIRDDDVGVDVCARAQHAFAFRVDVHGGWGVFSLIVNILDELGEFGGVGVCLVLRGCRCRRLTVYAAKFAASFDFQEASYVILRPKGGAHAPRHGAGCGTVVGGRI